MTYQIRQENFNGFKDPKINFYGISLLHINQFYRL